MAIASYEMSRPNADRFILVGQFSVQGVAAG